MKTSKVIVLVMAALALSATPALAQRGGGSRSGGGHSSSMSSSRSSSGSSSRSSSSFSGSSRSSSSSSSRSSVSSPSRSSSSSSSRSSMGTPSRSSSSGVSRGSVGTTRSAERGSVGTARSAERGSMGTVRSAERGSMGTTRSTEHNSVGTVRSSERTSHAGVRGREAGRTTPTTSRGNVARDVKGTPSMAPSGAISASGRPSSSPNVQRNYEGPGYARPGRPGGEMPPSARPIHPAPYFHHPWHGYMVHCHPIFWDPLPPRPWYWPGFWMYCNSYWYDYHVTDVVVVRRYVQDTYHVDMITYGISGDIMYAIVRDGGSTYLQVYDKDDHLLAEQKINKKYCNMVIDSDNGGCWISKKNNKDPLLFIWAEGQLLIYEAD